jgi:hypothetical protein
MSGNPLFRCVVLHRAFLLCFALTMITAPALCRADDWRYEETHRDVRDFVSGGSVHVHATVGDVHIKRGTSNELRLEYTVKSHRESSLKKASVDFEVRGNEANITFHAHGGGNTQFDVELEVPASTNLDVHQKVGDLTVENIEGDKDLELGVGDIRIANGASGYHLVQASTGIGDVEGANYGETSGWLGKKLKYHGEGKFELRAHVGVGDIHLEGK